MASTARLGAETAPEQLSFEETARRARKTLVPLLLVYMLGTLCLQAFNLVFQKIGTDLGAPTQASLITAIPGVVLGIVCFIYGSLGDFASLKKMTLFGIATLCVGSILGFLLHGSLLLVIIFRIIQTIGFQTAGSVYLVIVARYLKPSEKLLYFGLFTAQYQLATAIGVFSGGLFSSIDWSYLFLIPLLSLLVVIPLAKDLPDAVKGGKTHIDIPGFGLFGCGILFLTLFFSMLIWWMLAVSVAFFTLFAIYIGRAKDPFITPDFFRNTRWLKAVLLIFIFYFMNFSVTPLCNDFGVNVFGLQSSQVSFMLLPALIVATVVGSCSGQIVKHLGKHNSVVTGGTFMFVGLLAAAFSVQYGIVLVAISLVIFYSGLSILYSPLVDTVLDTLPPEQMGRGVGMNDLAMQGAGAIGIAVFGGPINEKPFANNALFGANGAAANASTMLVIYACIVIFGIVWMQVHHKAIYDGNKKA